MPGALARGCVAWCRSCRSLAAGQLVPRAMLHTKLPNQSSKQRDETLAKQFGRASMDKEDLREEMTLGDAYNWVNISKQRDQRLNTGTAVAVMETFKKHRKLKPMWEVLSLASKQKLKLPTRAYRTLFGMLRQQKQFDEALAMYFQLRRLDVRVNTDLFQYVIAVLGNDRKGKELDQVVADARDRRFKFTPHINSLLTYAYGRAGYAREAKECFAAFEAAINGQMTSRDDEDYFWKQMRNAAIGLGNLRDHSAVRKLEALVKSSRVYKNPRRAAFMQAGLAVAYGHAKDTKAVLAIRDALDEQTDLDDKTNDVINLALIEAFGQVGELVGVAQLYQEYLHRRGNLPPALLVLEAVALAFAEMGVYQEIKFMIQSAESRGRRYQVLYNKLIHALAKHGEFDRVEELVNMMKRDNIVVDEETLTWRIWAAANSAENFEARTREAFGELLNHPRYELNPTAFAAIVTMYLRSGRNDKVAQVFERMSRFRLRPNMDVYEAVASHVCRQSGIDGCVDMFIVRTRTRTQRAVEVRGILSRSCGLLTSLRDVAEPLIDPRSRHRDGPHFARILQGPARACGRRCSSHGET
mmetsp:Transcript_8688/g.26111  ORF Transcript_8688/g.26111 Transcript_8688/m.26111 type:complete len:583 (+) Transcript_8688:57-1805(+)